MAHLWNKLSKSEKDWRLNVQTTLEEDMLEAGVTKYWQEYDRSPDEAVPEQRLLDSAVQHMIPMYQHWIDRVASSKKSPHWVYPLMAIGPARMADITVRSLIKLWLSARAMQDRELPMPPTAQVMANEIAVTMIQVVQYQMAKKTYYDDWKRQSKYVKSWTPKRCNAFAKKMLKIPNMSLKRRQDFGHHMLRIAEQSGVVKIITKVTNTKRRPTARSYVVFPDEILKDLASRHELLETACLIYRPMVCSPVPHTLEESGGYLHPWIRKSMVQKYNPKTAGMDKHSTPSPLVLDGLNALMDTEWVINERVLDVMEVMFKNNHQVANLPAYDFDSFIYAEPYPKDGDKVTKAKWVQEKEASWSEWYKGQQARGRMLVRLSLARKMSQYDMFYMPWSLDFRGRGYTVCELLSNQGSDFDRSLVQWAEPVRRTARGDRWLKINIANLFDEDKCTEEMKVEWFDANEILLRNISEDPLSYIGDWVDDSPKKNKSFQRLAALFDYFDDPNWTQIPVNLDGSCNGSQHWAAIMGDERIARLTNVLPSDEKQDLYQFVADECTKYAQLIDNDWMKRFLNQWDEGFPRSVTKRSIMCDPYGITFYGIQKYMKLEGHVSWLPKEDQPAGCVELARVIQAGLGQVMTEPNKGKEYLRTISDMASDMNTHLSWTVPSGFRVVHQYNKRQTRRSLAVLFDRKELVFYVDSPDVDPKSSELGIPPNYIHSLDASHMFCTIKRMIDGGIRHLSFIHDSYGCPAPYVDEMRAYIQEEFYKMHKENQLEYFKQDVEATLGLEVPDPPARGTINLSEVLHSNDFFA